MMVTGIKIEENMRLRRYHCEVCGNGVGVNFILCIMCDSWCHKRCSALRSFNGVIGFHCSVCMRECRSEGVEQQEMTAVSDEIIGEVKYFGQRWWSEKSKQWKSISSME